MKTKVRNIPGKRVHRNCCEENISFLKKNGPLTTYPSQRAYTKHIEPVHVELAEKINGLAKKLKLNKKELLFYCAKLELTISDYTLKGFLNEKYGPAFPPSQATAESLFTLKQFLEAELRKTKQNKNTN